MYKFPQIHSLDQVRAVVGLLPEFIIADKDGGYTVVNYNVAFEDTFPEVQSEADAIRRECRGLIFNTETGVVVARRYHKFFNVNERNETQASKIDFSKSHVILEKLDGSMITPVPTIAGIRWGTKMGVTEVALPVEEFVAAHPAYDRLAADCVKIGVTPIFEWCSRKQRIVVDYPNDMLVLTAVRHNITGFYMNYSQLVSIGQEYVIPVVRQYPGTAASMEDLVANTRDEKGNEGWIVRFDSDEIASYDTGHMVKVKAEEYIAFHRTKAAIEQEKNVVKLILDEKVDDLKGMLLDEDRERVIKFESEFWNGLKAAAGQLSDKFYELYVPIVNELGHAAANERQVRALFAAAVNDANNGLDKFERRAMFQILDQKDALEVVKGIVEGSTSSNVKLNEVRHLFGNAAWSYGAEE